tara:strand:- start:175 stop:1200 length:1026 start_codon:yes stop_codon:yes gene_type:complete
MVQKRNITLIALSVVFLLFIAGCTGGGGDISTGAPTTPFLGGSGGLEIGFLEGSPPEEVTDGGTFNFQVVVSLKNVGEFALMKDRVDVDLIGMDPSDFGTSSSELINQTPEDDPTPKQRDSEGNIIDAIETFVTFPETGDFDYTGDLAGNTQFIFRADACYIYETKTVSEICVLENMIDVANDAICTPSEAKSVFSSGSPVKVTSFRQNVVGKDKLQISFDIVHAGSGNVFVVEEIFQECPKDPSTRRKKIDKVNVTVKTGLPDTDAAAGTSSLNCVGLKDSTSESTSTGSVNLVNGKRTVTCTQTLSGSRTDFVRPVDINVSFNYLESADTEVLVKHLVD